MTVDECYQLGYIVKPHGLKGELQVLLDVDYPEEYGTLESVFVLKGQQLIPFFIDSISLNGEKAIIGFEDIESLDAALPLKGCELYLPLNTLPELEGDGFYFHELTDFRLVDDVTRQEIGRIENVIDANNQTLLSVIHQSGKEILIPLSDELVNKLDREGEKLYMSLPEGLIDIYLNE